MPFITVQLNMGSLTLTTFLLPLVLLLVMVIATFSSKNNQSASILAQVVCLISDKKKQLLSLVRQDYIKVFLLALSQNSH